MCEDVSNFLSHECAQDEEFRKSIVKEANAIHALTAEKPQWFEADGVHPDNDGAAAIAEAVYQTILAGNLS